MSDQDDELKKVRASVREIYENYGIDPRSMGDDELAVVCDHYSKNKNDLERDLKKSKKHSGMFDNDIL